MGSMVVYFIRFEETTVPLTENVFDVQVIFASSGVLSQPFYIPSSCRFTVSNWKVIPILICQN